MRDDTTGRGGLPFHADATPFETPAFEEAAARLLFLAEHRWAAGWLRGPAGSGKTAVLRSVRRQLLRTGGEAALVSLWGVEAVEFWPTLAAALGEPRRPSGASRDRVRELLVAGPVSGRPIALLLDDADRGGRGVFDAIEMLLRFGDGLRRKPTVVVATTGDLGSAGLRRRIDLRVELQPFSAAETADYVAFRLRRAGSDAPTFATSAVEEIHSLTCGSPAAVNRLADLALVAARAASRNEIDARLVRTAARDLYAAADADLADEEPGGPPTAPVAAATPRTPARFTV